MGACTRTSATQMIHRFFDLLQKRCAGSIAGAQNSYARALRHRAPKGKRNATRSRTWTFCTKKPRLIVYILSAAQKGLDEPRIHSTASLIQDETSAALLLLLLRFRRQTILDKFWVGRVVRAKIRPYSEYSG